jgi:hypothetical protein
MHGTRNIQASIYNVLEDAKKFSLPTNKHVRLLSKMIVVLAEERMNFSFQGQVLSDSERPNICVNTGHAPRCTDVVVFIQPHVFVRHLHL